METVLSKEVQAGLDRARIDGMKRSSRLRVHVAGKTLPVLRLWKSGFAMEAGSPRLRGHIDLHDGSNHLFRCLIIASEEEDGVQSYEFKRATLVADRPARDFELPEDAPVALIEDAGD